MPLHLKVQVHGEARNILVLALFNSFVRTLVVKPYQRHKLFSQLPSCSKMVTIFQQDSSC